MCVCILYLGATSKLKITNITNKSAVEIRCSHKKYIFQKKVGKEGKGPKSGDKLKTTYGI